MRVQWFVIPSNPSPYVFVTADTRLTCARIANRFSKTLWPDGTPNAVTIAPQKDHKTLHWTQGFNLRGMKCEQVAEAFYAAIKMACDTLRNLDLTPPTGTPFELIEETKP